MNWTFGLDDLRGSIDEGADLAKTVAKKASAQYCKIRQKYPNLTRTIPPVQQFWDSYCSDIGEPPAPPPYTEFKGGQCSGDMYKVTIDRVRNGADLCNTNGFTVPSAVLYVQGKVNGLRAVETGNLVYSSCDQPNLPPAPNKTQYLCFLSSEGQTEPGDSNTIIYFSEFSHTDLSPIARIVNVENLSNPDDLCGDPDSYPPDPTVVSEDFTVSFTFNQQTTTTVESYEYNLDFSPVDIDVNAGFDINISANVGVDNSSTSFSATFGGDSITINRSGGGGGGNGSGGTGGQTENKEPSADFIPPGSGGQYEEELLPPGDELEPEPSENDIAFVLVNVTLPPDGGKTILFPDPEDNTFFAGYLAWIQIVDDEKYRYAEIPIRKLRNIFPAPIGAKTFRAYSVNGAKLSVNILRQPTTTQ